VLQRLLFGAGDNLVLQAARQVAEEVTVAGDPDDEVAVLVRFRLGSAQGRGRDDVELDVMPTQREVAAYQVGQSVESDVPSTRAGENF